MPNVRVKAPIEPVGSYVVTYCDGSCGAGDRIGGWGYVVHAGLDVHQHWGTAHDTTISQMELIAAIEALECMIDLGFLRRPVLLCTDSQYVTKGSQSKRTWMQKDDLKNADLWLQVWKLMDKFDHCSFAWVRGHAGHYWNEYVDRLADQGRKAGLDARDNARRERYGRT